MGRPCTGASGASGNRASRSAAPLIGAARRPDVSSMRTQTLGVLFLFAGMLAADAVAQGRLLVPKGALTAGTSVTVAVDDPSHAGQTVVLVLDGGGYPGRLFVEIPVQLDANGKGRVTWKVPDWHSVRFNTAGAEEVTRFVRPAR
jgi:hypothetical protein